MYDFSRLKKRARSATVGLAATGMVLSNVASVSALQSSSLSLSDPRPSETNVSYTFDTASFSGNSAQCIQLEFNTQADMAGTVPAGFTSTSATLNASSTMLTQASWNAGLDVTVNGTIEIVNGTGEILSNGNVVLDAINNSTAEGTYYASFRTYTDSGCSTLDDSVTVAYVNKNGELVQLTIDPSLTFTCSGVAASEAAAGTTTTHASTGAGINYLNDVTSSTNGVAAHDLNVSTNAAGGYTVYVRSTDQLTNANGDTIDNHAGTNAAPTAFPAAGTEAWGYNTSDATLSGTATRFTAANGFAGFNEVTNEEVMFNASVTPSTQTERVTNQVGVSTTTEAGTYQSTIIYTVVATF